VNLFVGNLSFQTTAVGLRALFEPFGQIARVHLPADPETGRARGFAFVEMASLEEANRAIAALDGKEFAGRKLIVNEARPRAGRPSAPRNSGGGRGGRNSFSTEDYGEAARQPREPRW